MTRRVERPERIDQIIPSIVEHDAVSNHTFAAQELLRSMGFASEIYAGNIGPGTEGRVRPLSELPRFADGSQWVLYQCSIGSPAATAFASHPGEKLLEYHNITPAELVERWLPPLGVETRLGRRQLADLAPVVRYAFADSPYNARELSALGYMGAVVVPVLIENAHASPDPRMLARLTSEKRDGARSWLFVGQIAPHKAQHDIVKALAYYSKVYERPTRLHLVGREMGNVYRNALRRFIRELSLDDVVELPGSVSQAELASYYDTADVFVCCSDHEGFCAPIVEAMAKGVPVVAFAAGAVAETVADAGVMLTSKQPGLVAATLRRVLDDDAVHAELARRGRARAESFSRSAAEAAFKEAITAALES